MGYTLQCIDRTHEVHIAISELLDKREEALAFGVSEAMYNLAVLARATTLQGGSRMWPPDEKDCKETIESGIVGSLVNTQQSECFDV